MARDESIALGNNRFERPLAPGTEDLAVRFLSPADIMEIGHCFDCGEEALVARLCMAAQRVLIGVYAG